MKLAIGCSFEYLAPSPLPATALLAPHSSLADTVVRSNWTGDIRERYTDLYGNLCGRLMVPEGTSSFGYDAVVEISPNPEQMPEPDAPQLPVDQLPAELLHWILPSRLCPSDLLVDRAWELFAATPPTAARVQAICDWVHDSIEYGVESVPSTTAAETLECRGGMCRDFAHLAVTFCRTFSIPARYVFGYIPDIGIPGPYPVMDFHAWFEAWLGGRWWTFDARFNIPRIGRVPIGRGRDAVDVAMVTTYGAASLERMTVWADPTPGEELQHEATAA
jgi:transglutaminase-like putative cysteine protease